MKLSLNVTNVSYPDGPASIAGHVAATAKAAEDSGLDTVWVADHLYQADPASSVDEPMLEACTLLGFVAGQTSTIKLGAMVSGVIFRPPATLIKAVTTLDVLSQGRAWLGVGAGYNADEAGNMGIGMPSTAERFDLLDDTVRLAKQMWDGDQSTFHGKTLTANRPIGEPRPRAGRLPVLIGGTGPKRTLRLVAELADACNLFDIPRPGDPLKTQLAVLQRHCDDVGRDYEEIERTVATMLQPGETPQAFADRCLRLQDQGLQHAVVIQRGAPWTEETVDVLARVNERIAA